jgi:hypothetical protein
MNKQILIVVAADERQRRDTVELYAVRNGFALTRSDARKIISPGLDEQILSQDPWFVMATTVHPRVSTQVWIHLFRIALSGRFVLVGAQRIPKGLDFMFQVITPFDI